MLTKLRLTNFKNFKEAELSLGPFTLLVGENASGKSNVRDAFRFLHGIGRGYNLAEIIGEKYGEGGVRLWDGIRGGIREIAYYQNHGFKIEATFVIDENNSNPDELRYGIEVFTLGIGSGPMVVTEALYSPETSVFDSHPDSQNEFQTSPRDLTVWWPYPDGSRKGLTCSSLQPALSQISIGDLIGTLPVSQLRRTQATMQALETMRFLDPVPAEMRRPSFQGQNTLGPGGENLSSVLQAICADEQGKETLLSWLQGLTPMDATDFKFPTDLTGRVLVTLVEKNGRETSAFSASDGTLRFLAMLAALLGPNPARFYFFEELDNGIHPTRLHLLVQLIENIANKRGIQVVATTHSPGLLRMLSEQSLQYASVVYRSEDRPDARIARILDLPDAERIVREQDIARLFESGWLEDALFFKENAEKDEQSEASGEQAEAMEGEAEDKTEQEKVAA